MVQYHIGNGHHLLSVVVQHYMERIKYVSLVVLYKCQSKIVSVVVQHHESTMSIDDHIKHIKLGLRKGIILPR